VNWTSTLFEVIDMRSFSNLWFWIGLAVIWSSVNHYVLGAPYDMITRARRYGGKAQEDLEALVRINADRLLHIGQVSGIILLGFLAFVLTSLTILGFWYGVEFAQALLLLALPLSLVGGLSLSAARRIAAERPAGDDLHRHLGRHRLKTQVIGMVSIFVTAMFGMYQNLAVSPGF